MRPIILLIKLKEFCVVDIDQALSHVERVCTTPTTLNSFGLLPQDYSERNTH